MLGTGQVHYAGFTLHNDVIAGSIFLRTRTAKTGDRAVDERWTAGVHGGKTEAKPIHSAGPEILHQHIGDIDQASQHLLAGGALPIECDALLSAIDGQKIRRLVALIGRCEGSRIIALARLLHLDHLRAEIPELHGAVGPGEDTREIDDTKPFERTHGLPRMMRGTASCGWDGKRGPGADTRAQTAASGSKPWTALTRLHRLVFLPPWRPPEPLFPDARPQGPEALEGNFRVRVSFLQLHAPVAQIRQHDGLTRYRAAHEVAGAQDLELAVEIAQLGFAF